MSHRKFEHPRHGSLGFLPRKRAARHRGKGFISYQSVHAEVLNYLLVYVPNRIVMSAFKKDYAFYASG